MGPHKGAKKWKHGDVLRFTSVAIRPHVLGATRGARAAEPCFTLRVDAAAKATVRDELLALFGYEHRTLFPDYPGFSTYGELSWG